MNVEEGQDEDELEFRHEIVSPFVEPDHACDFNAGALEVDGALVDEV
jgi:hypothetical protein